MELEGKKENLFGNLKWYEHLAAGWPLLMIFMGGMIGGACGGLAYGLNTKLFNSKLSNTLKYVFSFLIGVGCIGLYFLIIIILAVLFPGMFKK